MLALTILEVQAIQRDAAQRIAAAQTKQRAALASLAKKYRGLRPDGAYRLDEPTHSIVEMTKSEV